MADEGWATRQPDGDDSAAQPGDKWGDAISEERQAALRALFKRQKAWVAQPEATRGHSVFEGVPLTGADVYWLAQLSRPTRLFGAVSDLHLEGALIAEVNLEGAELREAHLEEALLSGTKLVGADLRGAQLAGAVLRGAHLEKAILMRAQLTRAVLQGAHLENTVGTWLNLREADLQGARLDGADLSWAHLEGAVLRRAHLEGASFPSAHLERADLREAHLEGVNFREAHLEGANLSRAIFNNQTDLSEVVLSDRPPGRLHWYSFGAQRKRQKCVYGPVSLADIHWNDVDLTVVDWSGLKLLGDERVERSWWSRDESEQAARANMQLAKRLRDAGLNDDADRYAYRARVMQRVALRLRRRYLPYLGSLFIDLLAGYGFRPERSLLVYLAVILWFANFYVWASHGLFSLGLPPTHVQPLVWYEGLILSVSSFHGRGFQPFQNLNDPIAALAGMQAVFGLIIEVSFIATFTQRFFAR